MSQDERKIPKPNVTPDTKEYWDAAEQGKLLIKRCNACSKNYFYPRKFCPFCMSDDTQWLECAGTGVVYSYSIMRRVEVPYVLAYVKLDEGPIMMTNIVDCPFPDVRIGQEVRVSHRPSDGGPPVPMFVPK